MVHPGLVGGARVDRVPHVRLALLDLVALAHLPEDFLELDEGALVVGEGVDQPLLLDVVLLADEVVECVLYREDEHLLLRGVQTPQHFVDRRGLRLQNFSGRQLPQLGVAGSPDIADDFAQVPLPHLVLKQVDPALLVLAEAHLHLFRVDDLLVQVPEGAGRHVRVVVGAKPVAPRLVPLHYQLHLREGASRPENAPDLIVITVEGDVAEEDTSLPAPHLLAQLGVRPQVLVLVIGPHLLAPHSAHRAPVVILPLCHVAPLRHGALN
uniref:Uncharacterized protein n=1 Tax=Strombidium rassoulzadegani TaxID=1082188 RepID=A0A7S3FW14_9SPIT|mmetsp:Transcript_6438/g.10927  ORF Transcript_6438/g.10927 Transcript_6438/m.10927 type:complete len:267 (+) Transcript_6438:34-834(+)